MTENDRRISQHDYDLAMLYDAMMDRHSKAPDAWGMPMMAVRLLTKRVGLDKLLNALELRGVAWVSERCRLEMVVRQEFFTRMIAEFPPEDAADVDKAAEELATDIASFDSPEATAILLKFLDRLLRRGRARQLDASAAQTVSVGAPKARDRSG